MRYFINITSFGVGGEIDRRVNQSSKALGGKLSFLIGSIKGTMAYKNRHVRVSVDGKPPTPAIRTDYTFLGIPLPAGATRVSLDFHDAAYAKGKTVTIVAVLLALLALGAGLLVDRRRVV